LLQSTQFCLKRKSKEQSLVASSDRSDQERVQVRTVKQKCNVLIVHNCTTQGLESTIVLKDHLIIHIRWRKHHENRQGLQA
jgi:hypothetical protein